jgi:hypothetical protein
MDKLMTYLICAKEFGWTPEQVDKVELYLLNGMLYSLHEINKREQREMKEAQSRVKR